MTEAQATILDAACRLAMSQGWGAVTRDAVAREAGIGAGSVNVAWGTIDALRAAVMTWAIEWRHLEIIAAGLSDGMREAKRAPDALKRQALATML